MIMSILLGWITANLIVLAALICLDWRHRSRQSTEPFETYAACRLKTERKRHD